MLIDAPLSEPSTGTSADVLIEVDENGFGQGAFTNVMLGSVSFGITLNITSIRVEATVTLSGVNFQPGDYDQSGVVDPDDYALWASLYGSDTDTRADGNDDGVVDAADYTVWRDAFDSPDDAVATPEPTRPGRRPAWARIVAFLAAVAGEWRGITAPAGRETPSAG